MRRIALILAVVALLVTAAPVAAASIHLIGTPSEGASVSFSVKGAGPDADRTLVALQCWDSSNAINYSESAEAVDGVAGPFVLPSEPSSCQAQANVVDANNNLLRFAILRFDVP
jgi:hypothetical protein